LLTLPVVLAFGSKFAAMGYMQRFVDIRPNVWQNERTPPQAVEYRSFSRGIAFGVL